MSAKTESALEPIPEVIGGYTVHPVAAMFPLLEGERYEELRVSIEESGQLYPIIVTGNTLLDGRNRLRVCLEVGIDPRIEEYRGSLPPVDYIMAANLDRRHLTDDMRVAICAEVDFWCSVQRAAKFKAEVGAKQGHHGKEGGRGHKKPLATNSSLGVTEPKTRAKDARSTVGQIAATAGVSHHKAAQAVVVVKTAPELLTQVAKGEVKLKDAAKVARAAKPVKATKPKPTAESEMTVENLTFDRFICCLEYAAAQCVNNKKYKVGWANDGYFAIYNSVGIVKLDPEHIAKMLMKTLTPEQRVTLRGMTW